MDRDEVIEIVNFVLAKRGKEKLSADLKVELRSHGFRSMDFSEVALRVEDAFGGELLFDAGVLRKIQTFEDVVTFFVDATS